MSELDYFTKEELQQRDKAISFLKENYPVFPSMDMDVTARIYGGWRFVRGFDGVTYFANGLLPGITQSEIR